jgi:hypothetical protein
MASGCNLKTRLGGDTGEIAEHSIVAGPIRARFDQMTVRRHVVQSPVLIKQRLVTRRTITIVGRLDLNRTCNGTCAGGRCTVAHSRNIPRIPGAFYSFLLEIVNINFTCEASLQATGNPSLPSHPDFPIAVWLGRKLAKLRLTPHSAPRFAALPVASLPSFRAWE